MHSRTRAGLGLVGALTPGFPVRETDPCSVRPDRRLLLQTQPGLPALLRVRLAPWAPLPSGSSGLCAF